ncbi:hypothetical protein ACFX5Q_21645 [Mesorhizobium sp. IMUNJ 23033]
MQPRRAEGCIARDWDARQLAEADGDAFEAEVMLALKAGASAPA